MDINLATFQHGRKEIIKRYLDVSQDELDQAYLGVSLF